MSPRPRDRAWPTVAVGIWLAATVGLIALTTNGPMFRPGVSASPTGVSLALIVALAVGWPLLTASARGLLLVGGQGAIALAIVAAALERPLSMVSLFIWIAAVAAAWGCRSATDRWRWRWEIVWSVLLMASAMMTIELMG